jgi:hypothetical protein
MTLSLRFPLWITAVALAIQWHAVANESKRQQPNAKEQSSAGRWSVTTETFRNFEYYVSDGTGKNWSVLNLRFNRSPQQGSLGPMWTYQEWRKGKQTVGRFGSISKFELASFIRLVDAVALEAANDPKKWASMTSGKANGIVVNVSGPKGQIRRLQVPSLEMKHGSAALNKLKSELDRIVQSIKKQPEEPVYSGPAPLPYAP